MDRKIPDWTYLTITWWRGQRAEQVPRFLQLGEEFLFTVLCPSQSHGWKAGLGNKPWVIASVILSALQSLSNAGSCSYSSWVWSFFPPYPNRIYFSIYIFLTTSSTDIFKNEGKPQQWTADGAVRLGIKHSPDSSSLQLSLKEWGKHAEVFLLSVWERSIIRHYVDTMTKTVALRNKNKY